MAVLLLRWYTRHQRPLPWRRTRDPYRVWVSEIMLQQTQVDTVIPYYRRWLARFPTVQALAAAAEADVLRLWEGLGYYSRARNLRRAAQIVRDEHHGQVPRTPEALRALPGIGRYTAAAIASICFGVDAAAVDGNVKRVLARVFDFREDVKSPRGEEYLWALAERLVPSGGAGEYNQALMELGATVCTPRTPACGVCPLRAPCRARRLGVQLERPVARARSAVPHERLAAAVIRKDSRVLLTRRKAPGLLGGLWAFPSTKQPDLPAALRRDLGLTIRVGKQTQTVKHAFTHRRWTLRVFDCRWLSGRLPRGGAACWVRLSDLGGYPMGKPDRTIARGLQLAAG